MSQDDEGYLDNSPRAQDGAEGIEGTVAAIDTAEAAAVAGIMEAIASIGRFEVVVALLGEALTNIQNATAFTFQGGEEGEEAVNPFQDAINDGIAQVLEAGQFAITGDTERHVMGIHPAKEEAIRVIKSEAEIGKDNIKTETSNGITIINNRWRRLYGLLPEEMVDMGAHDPSQRGIED